MNAKKITILIMLNLLISMNSFSMMKKIKNACNNFGTRLSAELDKLDPVFMTDDTSETQEVSSHRIVSIDNERNVIPTEMEDLATFAFFVVATCGVEEFLNQNNRNPRILPRNISSLEQESFNRAAAIPDGSNVLANQPNHLRTSPMKELVSQNHLQEILSNEEIENILSSGAFRKITSAEEFLHVSSPIKNQDEEWDIVGSQLSNKK